MSVVASPSLVLTRRFDAATLTIAAATVFNLVLCFLFTNGLPVGSSKVVAVCEIAISTIALILAWRGVSECTLLVMAAAAGYVLALSLIKGGTNAKIIRDLMIPLVYFTLGTARGDLRRADILVYALIGVVFAGAMVEWFDLDLYTRWLDIAGYYVAKGMLSLQDIDYQGGLYASGNRTADEGRMLLSFLGSHRVSSIFLEPIEEGNFAIIAFAWALLRMRDRPGINGLFLAVAVILIFLADTRLGALVCAAIFLAYHSRLLRERWFAAALPIAALTGLLILVAVWQPAVDEVTIMNRLYLSGSILANFSWLEWLGIRPSPDPGMIDAGYAYLVNGCGIIGTAVLWAVFALRPVTTRLGKEMRGAIAIYVGLSLLVGPTMFSIKTAALLWFLYGTAVGESA